MDIRSKAGFPAGSLSNFAPHPFVLDGVRCASMEGFLQSLKFASADMQAQVCTLVGAKAKKRGAKKNWQQTQTLYWRGEPVDRHSDAYQALLDRAFDALARNAKFRRALAATGTATLTHTMGRRKPSETILTCQEFTSRLHRIRNTL